MGYVPNEKMKLHLDDAFINSGKVRDKIVTKSKISFNALQNKISHNDLWIINAYRMQSYS